MDISASIAYLLAVKDDEELGLIRKACEITGKLYSKHLKDQVVNTVDSERVNEGKASKLNLQCSFVESQTFEIIRRIRISIKR